MCRVVLFRAWKPSRSYAAFRGFSSCGPERNCAQPCAEVLSLTTNASLQLLNATGDYLCMDKEDGSYLNCDHRGLARKWRAPCPGPLSQEWQTLGPTAL